MATSPAAVAVRPVAGPTGLLLPRSGNFADVYQVCGPDGTDWGVKCFTRYVPGLRERYAAVAAAQLPFAVGFDFPADGIRVGGAWRPVVKMTWEAGGVRRPADRLRRDVRAGAGRPAGRPAGEAGHPNYQHPGRAAGAALTPDVDRFPHLVIAAALTALVELGPRLRVPAATVAETTVVYELDDDPSDSALALDTPGEFPVVPVPVPAVAARVALAAPAPASWAGRPAKGSGCGTRPPGRR